MLNKRGLMGKLLIYAIILIVVGGSLYSVYQKYFGEIKEYWTKEKYYQIGKKGKKIRKVESNFTKKEFENSVRKAKILFIACFPKS